MRFGKYRSDEKILHDEYFGEQPPAAFLLTARLVLLCLMSASLIMILCDVYGYPGCMTIPVCTATALMILCSGTYNILDAKTGEMLYAGAPELSNNYVNFTQSAVDSVFMGFGGRFISVAMVFFAFSTIMAYYFHAESSILYLFRDREGRKEKIAVRVLQTVMLAAVVFGAVREADLIWQLGDIGVGVMAWLTVISLLILCPKAIRSLRDYEKKL